MLLQEYEIFMDSCKTLAGLASTIEREAADRELYPTAAMWRDRGDVLIALQHLWECQEEIVLDEIHFEIAIDTLINARLQLPGTVELHLVNRKTCEVAFLFGEDFEERLDFVLEKDLISELKGMQLFE